MDVVEDLSTFVDVTPDLESDESHGEDGDEELCKLPVQEGYDALSRRVSLANLWAESGRPLEIAQDDLPLQPPQDCPVGQAQGGSGLHARAPDVQLPEENGVSVQGKVDLGLDIFFTSNRDQIISWHPNRVAMAVVQLLFQRLAVQPRLRRRFRGKSTDALQTLKSWIAKGHDAVVGKCTARQRSYGRDLYRRIVSVLTGSPARDVAQTTQHLWEELSIGDKNSWSKLDVLFKREEVQHCMPEFLAIPRVSRRRVSDDRRASAQEADDTTCRGYGISLCYNTSIGRDDLEVIRIIQSGSSGDELRSALAEVACFIKFMDDCWDYFEALGKDNGFPLVACGLEHSENGSHPGQVHVHVFLGMEIRGAFFANNAPMGSIPREKLTWAGLKPGFIRPTQVARRSHSHIHKAVVQAYYYVAGPKLTRILLRCSAKLYKDPGQSSA